MSCPGVFISSKLTHPLTRGVAIDSPEYRELSRKIIQDKLFLRKIYDEWYNLLAKYIPRGEGCILEIGSGSGFCAELIPGVVTSDIVSISGIDVVFNACDCFPFADETFKSIVMINTFHHLPIPENFLREASRCLRVGGRLLMIEPWVTPWSRLVYTRFHHEPFNPDANEWEIPSSGPLSSANGAMPWIFFKRDRAIIEGCFPEFDIKDIHPFMAFRYLLSGGVSMRSFMPGCSFRFWRVVEYFCKWAAMFAFIQVEKIDRFSQCKSVN